MTAVAVDLINDRFPKAQWGLASRLQDQIAPRVHGSLLDTGKSELDGAGSRARSHDEIVFELLPLTVVNQVDTRIDGRVMDPLEDRHICSPACGSAATEIIDRARQCINAFHFRSGDRPDELHANHGNRAARGRRSGQCEYRLGGGQEDVVSGAAGQVFDSTVGLAFVFFEREG